MKRFDHLDEAINSLVGRCHLIPLNLLLVVVGCKELVAEVVLAFPSQFPEEISLVPLEYTLF